MRVNRNEKSLGEVRKLLTCRENVLVWVSL